MASTSTNMYTYIVSEDVYLLRHAKIPGHEIHRVRDALEDWEADNRAKRRRGELPFDSETSRYDMRLVASMII